MRISYNPLWKMLIDKGMNKKELRELSGISTQTLIYWQYCRVNI